MNLNNPKEPSLMKQLAIPLSNQNTVAKWLVIPRRRENEAIGRSFEERPSSKINSQRSGQCLDIDPLRGDSSINWIPACAGMTSFGANGLAGMNTLYSFRKRNSAGFILIELIMVIVIMGIIGSIVAVFLKAPIDQYMDVSRRAELTDIADMALYRLSSDISTAVPNSLRVAGCGATPCAVEFLPVRDIGRYRANALGGTGLCGAAGDDLHFIGGVVDSCFEIIGTPVTFQTGDYIVIGSTQSNGAPAYNTTVSGVLRAYTGAAGPQATVNFTATRFPGFARLPTQRFDVVDGAQQAVTYACEGVGINAAGDGAGQLRRYWHYGFNAAQVYPPVGLTMQSSILADKVSGCVIDYDLTNQRMGLLVVRLTLTSSNESVSLYHEIHVNNIP